MKHPLLDPNARLVIAHRGNRVRSAENTIEALVDAVELGADALEFDVRATSDGIAVLMHDPNLDRTTDGHGLLGSYTLSDIRTLNAAARAPGRAGTATRALIPSLEEVLDRFREIPLVVEVKERAAVAPTELLVRKFGAQNRIVIGSADAEVVRRFQRTGLPTCASVAEAARLIPMAFAGVRPPIDHTPFSRDSHSCAADDRGRQAGGDRDAGVDGERPALCSAPVARWRRRDRDRRPGRAPPRQAGLIR
jgi:glycerophosphoryl diester phosphodiesterase